MNLLLVTKVLKDLLAQGGGVSLGRLGTFRTEDVPAYFSDRGYTINPPYRKILFDQNATRDDGRIAKAISKSNPDVNPNTVRDAVDEVLMQIEQEMKVKKSVHLPGLGRLRITSDGTVFFVEDEGLRLFTCFDLLQPVSLKCQEEIPQMATETQSQSTHTELVEAVAEQEEVLEKEAETVSGPAPEPSPVTEPETEPVPVAEEEEVSEDAAETAAETTQETSPETISRPKHRALKAWGIGIAAAVVLFFGLLAILGRACPEIIDPFLYNTEELEVLHTDI